MSTEFVDKNLNLKEIPKNSSLCPQFFENSKTQISDIVNFLNSKDKVLLIKGFMGTGKTEIVNNIKNFLSPNVLYLKYTCFETTILDDMLLDFFESFRYYTVKGKIKALKIKVDNFTQKINLYFNSVKLPILVIIDSYDSVLKNNKNGIVSFIKHISKLNNIKVIITTRNVSTEEFTDIKYRETTLLPLSKENFEKFLKENNIKNIGVLSNELYQQTKGYFFYVNLAVKMMQARNYSLSTFLEVYSKSLLSFSEFMKREALSLVDPISLHLFRILAVMRIPIHINLLRSFHLCNESAINFFVENNILSREGKSLYLKDYFRDIIENQIQENVMIKLHKACVDLYNTQLPLKPLERDLRLSRQTMRNEIDYHSLFIPKKPNINFVNVLAVPTDNTNSDQEQQEEIKEETKEEKLQRINFIIEDEGLLDNIALSIEDYVKDKIETKEISISGINLNLTEVLNLAHQQEEKYNYKNASILYQSALTKKNDDYFDKFLPTIYLNLAKVYKKMSNWYEALEYYTKAQDYFYNVSDIEKIYETKYEIANIYYIMYKHDNAKYILDDLEKENNLPNELRIRVNIAQGKLSTDLKVEFEYYKKALKLVDYTTSSKVSSELYYRLACINDELDNTKLSMIFYKKCIEVDSNPKTNEYLSKSLINIAEIYEGEHKSDLAKEYYERSEQIDLEIKNYNGLYSSSRHLAEIYSSKEPLKSIEYLNKAYEYANLLNEPYYIIDVSLELSNYYLIRKDYKNSYAYLVKAKRISQYSVPDEFENVKSKIEYVEKFLSDDEKQSILSKNDK